MISSATMTGYLPMLMDDALEISRTRSGTKNTSSSREKKKKVLNKELASLKVQKGNATVVTNLAHRTVVE